MRRPMFLAALVVAAALIPSAPLVSAAARLDVKDVDVFNQDDVALTRVQLQAVVRLQANVRNAGDTAQDGAVSFIFHVFSDDLVYDYNRTVTTEVSLAPNAQTNVSHTWSPTRIGKHTLDVYVQDQAATKFTLHFTVAESEVVRTGLLDRALDYVWVYVSFLGAVVLFFAVARVRKSR